MSGLASVHPTKLLLPLLCSWHIQVSTSCCLPWLSSSCWCNACTAACCVAPPAAPAAAAAVADGTAPCCCYSCCTTVATSAATAAVALVVRLLTCGLRNSMNAKPLLMPSEVLGMKMPPGDATSAQHQHKTAAGAQQKQQTSGIACGAGVGVSLTLSPALAGHAGL